MLRGRLSFEIAALLCAKLVALSVLYYAFFAPGTQPRVDAHAISARLFSPPSHP